MFPWEDAGENKKSFWLEGGIKKNAKKLSDGGKNKSNFFGCWTKRGLLGGMAEKGEEKRIVCVGYKG